MGGEIIVTPVTGTVSGSSTDPSLRISKVARNAETDLAAWYRIPAGMQVRLEAVAKDGYWFSRWNQDCLRTTPNVCTLTIIEDSYVGATFVGVPDRQSDTEN